MDYEVVDNFLDQKTFEEIKNSIFSFEFPWFFADGVASQKDPHFYFIHLFYTNTINSSHYEKISPIVQKINPQAIIRIKANLHTKTEKCIAHETHIDYDFSHQGAIFYINGNNGPTVLHDGTEIYPKENRILFFDPSKPHCSTTCTDQKARVNINFNYFKVK